MRRIVFAFAATAAATSLSACSTEDMASFNAGLEMYNGVTYYDTTDPTTTMECPSGNGYLLMHSGVRSNQQYFYVTSNTGQDVEVQATDEAGGGTTFYVPAWGQSDTYWTYPSYSLEYQWAC